MLKQFQGKTGMNIIEGAIQTFQNVNDQLDFGIQNCKEAKVAHKTRISALEDKIRDEELALRTLELSIERAEGVKEKIEKLIS